MRRREFIVLLPGLGFLGLAIPRPLAEPGPPQAYDVFKGERLVLTVRNRPGPLGSTALAPPGGPPALHPFASGAAHAPDEEPSLRDILERSRDFPDFAERLRRAGYTLRERTAR